MINGIPVEKEVSVIAGNMNVGLLTAGICRLIAGNQTHCRQLQNKAIRKISGGKIRSRVCSQSQRFEIRLEKFQ